jgi:Peptidase_C39 like family
MRSVRRTSHPLAASLVTIVAALSIAHVAQAAQPISISFHAYRSATDFRTGTLSGTKVSGSTIVLGSNLSSGSYTDPYGYGTIQDQFGSWTSPWFDPTLSFTELVSSWNADTPTGTWIEVQMQATRKGGGTTKWYTMGIWAYGDETIHRTSVGGQGDGDGWVSIDTFFAKDHPMLTYRLQVRLLRVAGSSATPAVRTLGAVASDAPNEKPYIPSALGGAEGITLNVPSYSQELHTGQYPQWDGGGEAWCSPTSTEMVVESWGKKPSASDLSWVDPSYADPDVDYAARYTYDYHYQGTGNWPFNAAYAARYGLSTEVTQLRSLTEAESFIKAGIPLVASIAANPNQLQGFLFDKGTNGHLLVIVGFTSNGDVVVNDPAETSDSTVRKVYSRTDFERAWLPATGGIVYVIHPSTVPLPPTPAGQTPNW